MANRWGNETVEASFWGAPKSLQMVTAAMKLKDAWFLEEKLWHTWRVYKKADSLLLPTKVHLVKAIVFPVVMYGWESWTMNKAECWRIDTFELWCWRRLLRVPWTARRSNKSILKENQSWIFIGSTNAEAEAPILWSPDAKSWLIGKDPGAGKDWRRKGTTEDEMVTRQHRLNRHEFELWEMVKVKAWHAAVHGVTKSPIWMSNWTTTYIK